MVAVVYRVFCWTDEPRTTPLTFELIPIAVALVLSRFTRFESSHSVHRADKSSTPSPLREKANLSKKETKANRNRTVRKDRGRKSKYSRVQREDNDEGVW
jgi:hypothetical protein